MRGCLGRKIAFPLLAALALAFGVSLARQAGAEEVRNPRLQRSLQLLEVARGHLDAAMQRYPREMREETERTAREVDGAAHDIVEVLAALGTRRSVEPGRAVPSDHPAHAARDAVRQALDELTNGVSDADLKGRVRAAFDHERVALDRAEALARREEAMAPPPPPVVEMRHPRLQRSIQLLEVTRAYLEDAERRTPPEWREEIRRAARDVDAAGHEAADALAAAGATRTIETARAEATDRPIRAARDTLHKANDELAAVAGDEFRGHVRLAMERARIAMDEMEGLARREERR